GPAYSAICIGDRDHVATDVVVVPRDTAVTIRDSGPVVAGVPGVRLAVGQAVRHHCHPTRRVERELTGMVQCIGERCLARGGVVRHSGGVGCSIGDADNPALVVVGVSVYVAEGVGDLGQSMGEIVG